MIGRWIGVCVMPDPRPFGDDRPGRGDRRLEKRGAVPKGLNHCKAKALGEKALHHPADHIVVIYETRRNTRHARSTTTKDISIIPLFH